MVGLPFIIIRKRQKRLCCNNKDLKFKSHRNGNDSFCWNLKDLIERNANMGSLNPKRLVIESNKYSRKQKFLLFRCKSRLIFNFTALILAQFIRNENGNCFCYVSSTSFFT